MQVLGRVSSVAAVLFLLTTPSFADTTMIFPRVVFQKGRFLGIAIANPTAGEAQITLTAYNLDGTPFAGAGVRNAVVERIPAGSQYARVAAQVFTPPASVNDSTSPTRLWIEVKSPTDGLTGFFLEGDDAFQFMDGADLGGNGTDMVVPLIENTGAATTEISLINPGAGDANVTIDFLRADGSADPAAPPQTITVRSRRALQGPLAGYFNVSYANVAALRLRSDSPVVCYASIFRQSDNSVVTIAAQDVASARRTLYFPHLAEGDGWSTAVGLVNLNLTSTALVTLTAYQDNGTLFTAPGIQQNPVTREIPPGGVFRSSLRSLFGFSSSPLKVGWLKVEANSSSINGFVEYGAGTNRALVTAQTTPYQLSIFSHQAVAPPYYTGLAVLNTGSLAVNLEVFSLTAEGATIGSTQRILRPSQKESLLIDQWIPSAAGKVGGSVLVRTDRPVIATQLFGTNNFASLANVPPQQVTTNFSPAGGAAKITTLPPLAVVETGKSQPFTAQGQPGLVWGVDGVQGGNPTVGTISAAGLYTAPTTAPASHTLTIQASTAGGDRSGGSSIDIVQRETLTAGLTLVTSVAYVENLHRFFIAEQLVLSSEPGRISATTTNTRISEVSAQSGAANQVIQIPNDTVAKMITFVDGAATYLLLAGFDSGKIYRLNFAATPPQLATAASGLNQPISLALDPVSGNLLVAEAGGNAITVIPRAQILAASAPQDAITSESSLPPLQQLPVQSPRGIAVDKCTGAVYVTLADGTLHEYHGTGDRIVVRNLRQPGQIQVLYREGLPCADGLTLAVVEADRITLVYPKSALSTALITGLQSPRDVTFFPSGNPFVDGGEASVGVGEAPQGAGAGRVSQIAVGGIYNETPSDLTVRITEPGRISGAYQDPEGDTFGAPGQPVADILSVSSSRQSGSLVVTMKLKQEVDGIQGFVLLRTKDLGRILEQFAQYLPFALDLQFNAIIDLSTGTLISLDENLPEVRVRVSNVGTTVSFAIPGSGLDLSEAAVWILLGSSAGISDIAPNGGFLNLTP